MPTATLRMPDLPIAVRIHQYLATLAPHMREREAAMLLAEAKDELATLRAEIDRLRWIPVTERLPAEEVRVLAYDGEDVFESEYWCGGWDWELDADVSHWMPLPEPPDAT